MHVLILRVSRYEHPRHDHAGMGALHVLSDEIMLELLGLLPASALVTLSRSSKSLYAFATHEEIWKALVLEAGEGGEGGCLPRCRLPGRSDAAWNFSDSCQDDEFRHFITHSVHLMPGVFCFTNRI